MSNDKTILKHCACCCGKAETHWRYIPKKEKYLGFVKCCDCGLSASAFDDEPDIAMDLAREKWNTRRPMERIVDQLEDEVELSYADFEAYAEEHGLDEESDDFRFGMRRAIEIVQKEGAE